MTFNIKWNRNGVYLQFRGVVSSQDLIDANNYVISNAKFEQIKYQIFDFLQIDDFNITSYDMTIIGTMDKSQSEFKSEMKVAVLTQDRYVRDLTNEYNQLMAGSHWITQIFPDLESAKNWVEK